MFESAMSWQATSYVKGLRVCPNGEKLKPGEKMVLLVLADYYSEEQGCAWPGVRTIAKDALLSERRTRWLLHSLSGKGVITIESRYSEKDSPEHNIYRIPGLNGKTPPGEQTTPPPGDETA